MGEVETHGGKFATVGPDDHKARVKHQLEALDWLVGQCDNDTLGSMTRAWIILKRNLIRDAGGTPK